MDIGEQEWHEDPLPGLWVLEHRIVSPESILTLVKLNPDLSFLFENTVDQDQLASDEDT